MGSVKDLVVIEKPTEDRLGTGRFIFSDRYSVFDYGEMPDLIENKGRALCLITSYFFEILEREGIKTHYLGLVKDDRVLRIDEIEEPSNTMEVRLVRVIKPEYDGKSYDYSIFKNLKGNFLIPLEIIYRNSLPEGSSVFRRLMKGEISPEDIELKEIPEPGSRLERPVIDFSTKLEDIDRYLKRSEAMEISGLNEDEFEELVKLVEEIDGIISREVSKAGIENLDGKVEFGLDEGRRLMLVDAVGTPDECRFSFKGTEMSKEVLRKYYRKTEWFRLIEKFKGEENWREHVGKPPKLPEELRIAVSEMYMSACNEITGKKWFDSPKLGEVMKKISEFLEVYDG